MLIFARSCWPPWPGVAWRGVADSAGLQTALGRSQPTVSRLLATLSGELLVLGAGRRTRYALPHAILGLPAQQRLLAVGEDGQVREWGRLSFLHGQRVHVQAEGTDKLVQGGLPWFLAPLRGEGFIGRLRARALAAWGLPANPEHWTLKQTLFAALHMPDAPGALQLGETAAAPTFAAPANTATRSGAADWDTLAEATTALGRAGSSAGGEQAKFLTRDADGHALLVKFTPPRATPFGTR